MSLKDLRVACENCYELFDWLCYFVGFDRGNELECMNLIPELMCNDTLWMMADQNDMNESDMADWIKDHLESDVQCRIFQECGPAGGWPVVEVQCLDKVFYFDVVDE